MEQNSNLEYRMYFLTMRNISEIQKGIQCGHAAIEYSLKYQNDPIYQEWAKNHKTFVLLNGGVSNHNTGQGLGSMELHLADLIFNNVKIATFYEPDLNNSLSAIAFILDERVFNKKKYPDFENWATLRTSQENSNFHQGWEDFVGRKQNVWLREFKNQFNLA